MASHSAIDPQTGLDTTEFQRMLQGKPYLASDPYRCHIAAKGADAVYEFNQERSMEKRVELLRSLVKNGSDVEDPQRFVALPFFCEYVSWCAAPIDS
ncbi:hypothetical protein QFC19_009308 [Naganishia cerealis]|uniref:Uncharacterized protein n=1 Tax=Naganishia cerealis TaxID=610337 RepID=A0ACC2UVM5_9TREE|nr:hypothetical protein QFC19_009308 [Naganishia cerealis]